MKAEEQFEKSIRTILGDDFFEEIKDMYQTVKTNRDKNKDCERYGCDEDTIKLMRHIRGKMREMGLAPSYVLKNIPYSEQKIFYQKRTELLKNNETFKNFFPNTWLFDTKIKSPNTGYTDDGWNYSIIGAEFDDCEWVVPIGRNGKKTHYYYNELDHYLTYLIWKIREKANADDNSKECGLTILKNEIDYIFKIVRFGDVK